VIIWPVEVENAKMCFRPSGETAGTTEGDAAPESAERMSYLTRVSLMRETAHPSYPIIWTPEALTNTNIVADWTIARAVSFASTMTGVVQGPTCGRGPLSASRR
jgi:hypothetical protein